MAGTPPEDLLEWLLREEEKLGAERVSRATMDIEEAKRLLEEELGPDYTEAQATAFQEAGMLAYEKLPQVGASFERLVMPWGYQSVYRDVITGRYVSREDVWSALAAIS